MWKPILEGDLKNAALASVEEVVNDLITLDEYQLRNNPSLAGGLSGLSILLDYFHRIRSEKAFKKNAERHLSLAWNAMAQYGLRIELYSGFSGIGWALAHLLGEDEISKRSKLLTNLNGKIVSQLSEQPISSAYDLTEGLVGIGVYALEARSLPLATECLHIIVNNLDKTALAQNGGLTWLSSPDNLSENQRALFPQGYYNLGLAHGVPGIIVLLARLVHAGIAKNQAKRLLEGSIKWTLAQRTKEEWGFPDCVPLDREKQQKRSRIAWCYGDLGVGVSILAAGLFTGEKQWKQQGLDILRLSAQCQFADTGVVDPGLCHGSAGMAHIFNRVFQATGETSFAEAATFWYEQTLKMRRPGEGPGGYWSDITKSKDSDTKRCADGGFLTGATGIALALLSAATETEPSWDRCMLTEIPIQA